MANSQHGTKHKAVSLCKVQHILYLYNFVFMCCFQMREDTMLNCGKYFVWRGLRVFCTKYCALLQYTRLYISCRRVMTEMMGQLHSWCSSVQSHMFRNRLFKNRNEFCHLMNNWLSQTGLKYDVPPNANGEKINLLARQVRFQCSVLRPSASLQVLFLIISQGCLFLCLLF